MRTDDIAGDLIASLIRKYLEGRRPACPMDDFSEREDIETDRAIGIDRIEPDTGGDI